MAKKQRRRKLQAEKPKKKIKIKFKWWMIFLVALLINLVVRVAFDSDVQQKGYMDIIVDSPPDNPLTFQEPVPEGGGGSGFKYPEYGTDDSAVALLKTLEDTVGILWIPIVAIAMAMPILVLFSRRGR